MGQDQNSGAIPTPDSISEVRVAAVQENIAVGIETVETGAVRVRKVVHEEDHPVSLQLRSQKVDVQRIPINRPVEEKEEPRREGDTLVIPVYEYVPVVRMQLTLKEEVRVKTTEAQEDVTSRVLTSSEELVVERRDGPNGPWKKDCSFD
jgi:stress response protein YsnF